jgi:thiol:disulfide interchange protein DsbD
MFVLFSGCLTQSNKLEGVNSSQANTSEDGKITLKELNFFTEVPRAMVQARVEGKPVFLYARSEYCGACKQFEAETFTNQKVIKTLNENFILLSIDVDKQKTDVRNFRLHITPTAIFLDKNGIEIKRMLGYRDTRTFQSIIDEIIKPNEAKP